MGDMPAFIAVETGGDGDLPLAIAWSLDDGRIKHTLIQPDEDWLDAETVSLGDYSREELASIGVSPLDVIRELETDHFNATLLTAGVFDDEAAISRCSTPTGWTPSWSWHRQRPCILTWTPVSGRERVMSCSVNLAWSRCAPSRRSKSCCTCIAVSAAASTTNKATQLITGSGTSRLRPQRIASASPLPSR